MRKRRHRPEPRAAGGSACRQSRVARALTGQGALPDGLTEARALDVIYTLMSPEVHHILTAERGWSADEYERGLARTLAGALLPPGP
jgi:hypothetical protein